MRLIPRRLDAHHPDAQRAAAEFQARVAEAAAAGATDPVRLARDQTEAAHGAAATHVATGGRELDRLAHPQERPLPRRDAQSTLELPAVGRPRLRL